MQHERFGGMRNDTAKTPTEEELRIAEKAYEEADPTQFSALDLKVDPVEIGTVPGKLNRIVTDGVDSYYSLLWRNRPKQQKFTARMLKGIVPVSDIVGVTNSSNLYSKKLPHERIKGEPVTDEEIIADTELLYLVFGDYDHFDENDSTHNAHVESEQISYHDFEMTSMENEIIALRKIHTLESLEILLLHLKSLKQRLEGDEGMQFIRSALGDAHITASSFYSHTATAEDLQSTLLRRIGNAEAFARMKRSELQQESAS